MNTVASGTLSSIPGAAIFVTVFSTTQSFVNGISTETVINDASIAYTWSQATQVMFFYVKKKGETDSNQYLTFISSKVDAAIGWQYPLFSYINSNGGTTTVSPSVIQGNRTISAVPTHHNDAFYAVEKYPNGNLSAKDLVNSITLTGIESKNISSIFPVNPNYPSQIY
ncbi:hypothetical protein [Paenibacillus sp. PL91]|uniref:hypothetical protein n=1 Tax=Paenibacillus sp. PL91 TaxID=2729538 RepID=UPI00145EEC3E|nr:hypothetical protein [Paenibacillus sp. PL91]MBC9203762.1 hypothetical protein [Paenibacillus sp. PL91]